MSRAQSLLLLAAVFSGLNLVLLGALSAVWLRNYWTFRTKQVLALCSFAALLAGENLAALAFHLGMGMLYADATGPLLVATGLRGLQFVALCFLAWATLQ
ncbi:hypothetical protein [Halopiger aswanensis]|uniref:Uncharacterized protein n=1 Tax=Halopiger aswanensis TaxID=148449 RepID=A0A419WF55_9EURY|nr:hypothetical protein [Halopiger aswanensis]RKD94022.1 hypothetical protein ATJ93_3657 [Halopiger aswanensis]